MTDLKHQHSGIKYSILSHNYDDGNHDDDDDDNDDGNDDDNYYFHFIIIVVLLLLLSKLSSLSLWSLLFSSTSVISYSDKETSTWKQQTNSTQ